MPPSYRGYIEKRKKFSKYILTGIVLVTATLLVYGLLSLIHAIYENELGTLRVERKQLENRIGTLGEYEKTLRSVSDYEKLVKEAEIPIPVWEEIISDISAVLPYGIWFDSISLKYENNKGKCEITGRAVKKDIIAVWLKDIEGYPYFKNVNLKYITENEEEGKKITRYIIEMDVIVTS